MSKPDRVHYVTMRVTFNSPVARMDAVEAVRDCIWGDFYPDVGTAWRFEVTGVKSAKRHKSRARIRQPRPVAAEIDAYGREED